LLVVELAREPLGVRLTRSVARGRRTRFRAFAPFRVSLIANLTLPGALYTRRPLARTIALLADMPVALATATRILCVVSADMNDPLDYLTRLTLRV
jgi:hypothetical protein